MAEAGVLGGDSLSLIIKTISGEFVTDVVARLELDPNEALRLGEELIAQAVKNGARR